MSNTIILQKFISERNKLDNSLEANGLIGTFATDNSPIMLTIVPNAVDTGQMTMLNESDDDKSSLDARLSFIFKDGTVIIKTDEKLVIPEDLMNKLKNRAKKMHYLYLQAAFESFISGESAECFTQQFVGVDEEDEGEQEG